MRAPLHTPEEAGHLWCPMARTPVYQMPRGTMGQEGGQFVAANRLAQDRPVTGCIGDRCAMWRWGEWERKSERYVAELEGGCRKEATRIADVPTKGYCGLAGRPEEEDTP